MATCRKCRPAGRNTAKANLEHYLTATVPFAPACRCCSQPAEYGPTASRPEPGTQAKARGRHVATSTREAGVYLPTSTVPFKPEKLDELFAFIAKGLLWHPWHVLITPDTAGVWAGILKHG